MGKTSIEWTDASWNPVVGCTEVSPGCANCYAARLAATRLKNVPAYKALAVRKYAAESIPGGIREHFNHPRWTGEVRFLPERLEEPLHWKKPRRIFVCDMGDLFHEDVPDDYLKKIFWTIATAPHHTFQILTKRPLRARTLLQHDGVLFKSLELCGQGPRWPLPNVWLGVSVENQHFADERIPLLLATPAAVRFISAEPLLGPIDLRQACEVKQAIAGLGRFLHWCIVGGESGPGARVMNPEWCLSLCDQCQAAGVPFFFKQWGEWAPWPLREPDGKPVTTAGGYAMMKLGKKKAGRLLFGREWNEFPIVAANPILQRVAQ